MKRPTAKEIFTVPNAISTAGFGAVVKGSIDADPAKSLAYTTAGRALDLVDGVAARALDQGSDFGAGVDALLDKLGMAAIISGGVYHKRIPKTAAAAVVAHNALNAGASIANEIRHPNEPARPSKVGKVGLFVENIGLLSYLASSAVEAKHPDSRLATNLKLAGHALTAAGVGLGAIAGAGYLKRARK
jgi:phosphatidylglycerophosphate synthase